jgi:hypothetical protein
LAPIKKQTYRSITALTVLGLLVGTILWLWPQADQPSRQAATPAASTPKTRLQPVEPNPFFPSATPATAVPGGTEKILEICGVGRVAPETADQVEKSLEATSERNAARWQAALLNSDDPRARAVGLFIEDLADGNMARATRSQPAIDSLVQLTEETHDPAAYAIALMACSHHAGSTPQDALPASCGQISAAGWTTIDSGNAASWLALAAIARTDKDVAKENAAFAQAAKATAFEAYNWSLFGFAEAAMPRDLNPLERSSLSIRMVGIEAAVSTTTLNTASKHCSAEAVRDEETRGQCEQLANLLVTKGTNVLELAMGTAIGTRVEWPKSRIAELTQQKEAFLQAEMLPAGPELALACDTVARQNRFFHDWAQQGELGAVREIIGRSGESIADWAQKYRDFRDNLQHTNP